MKVGLHGLGEENDWNERAKLTEGLIFPEPQSTMDGSHLSRGTSTQVAVSYTIACVLILELRNILCN